METLQKKEIKKAYQQKKIIGGIYAIQNTKTDKWFVKESHNLEASKNLFDFSKKINDCTEQKLKQDWLQYGSDYFCFIVLEELEKGEEQTRKSFQEDLKELLQIWLEKLSEKILY
ncbi:GIY-YIG nuclease family protein [Clostridium sp. MD294]|uniref:GIY-YIG nuclease family protein n=1 Tax=Clostridium sp. MD294 TaxID=97138 RepID=UPI0002CC8FC0|nr:GIY-YIG nuclease family protein [Clostridium sp. MD294]NDO46523.1 GIY-YIG nuclease family protein [Clostridium sp. MD294]USF29047.1 hypothetical protein C820_000430 [Clostridium sp. MD294]